METIAVVAHEPEGGHGVLTVETIKLKKSKPGPGEALIRCVASGICHTDVSVSSAPSPFKGEYPRVLGHEGAGQVVAVGEGVSGFKEGDVVLLSYTYCNECEICRTDHRAYCERFTEFNVLCGEKIWQDEKGTDVGGKFFGQSSWAGLTMVDAKTLVNVTGKVKSLDELKLLAPLGCGLMTGSGAAMNTANLQPHDGIIVTGLGAVGLGALMYAKIVGCRAIIAIDRVPSRLAIAKELGATAVFNTSDLPAEAEGDFSKEIKKLAGTRLTYAFETTGVNSVIRYAFKSLGKRGMLIQIGVPRPEARTLPFDLMDFFDYTKQLMFNYLGDSIPQEHIPRMIEWYKQGKFPFDKVVKFYAVKDVNQAIKDMHGEVIKPILLHDLTDHPIDTTVFERRLTSMM